MREISVTLVVVSDCARCEAALRLVEDIVRENRSRKLRLTVVDPDEVPADIVATGALTHPTLIVASGGVEHLRMTNQLSKRKVLRRLLPLIHPDETRAVAELRRQLDSPAETFPTGPLRARVRKAEKIALLSSVPLFEGMRKRDLAHIVDLCDELEADAGDVLVREGERGDEFFIVVDGRVEVDAVASGAPIGLGPGEWFGEMSLLDDGPRSATVTVTSPSTLLVVNRTDFDRFLAVSPGVARALLTTLSRRLR